MPQGKIKRVQNNTKTAHAGFQKGNRHGFKPGQSGNPGGRPKSKLVTQAYQELLEEVDRKSGKTFAQIIAEKVIREALNNNLAAVKEITDRTEGKAAQAVVVGGAGGGPPTMRVIIWDVSKGPPKEIMEPQSAGLTPTSP